MILISVSEMTGAHHPLFSSLGSTDDEKIGFVVTLRYSGTLAHNIITQR